MQLSRTKLRYSRTFDSTGDENYPHLRSNCANHSYLIVSHLSPSVSNPRDGHSNGKFCRNCYCFVCEIPARDCENWMRHCHARYVVFCACLFLPCNYRKLVCQCLFICLSYHLFKKIVSKCAGRVVNMTTPLKMMWCFLIDIARQNIGILHYLLYTVPASHYFLKTIY